MEVTALEPCPFCGSTDLSYDSDIESIVCPCSATGPSMLSRDLGEEDDAGGEGATKVMDAATDAWNRRHPK